MREDLHKNLPDTPGVYLMKDRAGRLLYVGKAANLKRRVSSYFTRPHDYRIEKLVSEISKIGFEKTLNALEALVLESALIKKHQPPYNIKEKDDKSFLFVAVTKDIFPRVLLVRGKNADSKKYKGFYGPFVYSSSVREALRIVRRIFPFSIHPPKFLFRKNLGGQVHRRACFDYELCLCPGTCIGMADRKEYGKTLRNIGLIFSGKTSRILRSLERDMKEASKKLDFERAGKLKRQLFALKHIQDSTIISDSETFLTPDTHALNHIRVEGYDISNISEDYPVGSMVVSIGGKPARAEYRKFKIKDTEGQNDVGMMAEILRRRFSGRHTDWRTPSLVLVDGGLGQVNAAEKVLSDAGLKIPVVGIAKGAKRKNNRFVGSIPAGIDKKTLIRLRDEAHKYAITYHPKLRGAGFLN